MIAYFANPVRFIRFSNWLAPGAAMLAAGLGAWGLYLALLASPPDYLQGELVRIMYVHVPAAWIAMAGYAAMGVASLTAFIWRHALADVAAKAIAPVGASFAFLNLVSGAIWGKPTWGACWVWDARLVSMLVLFLFYLGYMALRAAIEDERQAERMGAILCMAGVINLPIIKFSVDWWSTLHQPASVFRAEGSTIHSSQLTPLLICALAWLAFFSWAVLTRMRAEVRRRRVMAMEAAR